MMTEHLSVRANPEHLDIVETYSYHVELAKSVSVTAAEPPAGRLRAVYPYEAGIGFGKAAVEDLERQVRRDRGPLSGGERTATVGHLLFADWDRTDLESSVLGSKGVASIPLEIPVWCAVTEAGGLVLDHRRRATVVESSYSPRSPAIVPLSVSVDLMDWESLAAERIVAVSRAKHANRDALVEALRRPSGDLRGLVLVVRLSLALEEDSVQERERGAPKIKAAALSWPTIPWSESLFLTTGLQSERLDGEYRPALGAVEWRCALPMEEGKRSAADASVPARWSRSLIFVLDEVADLAHESHLQCSVEIEIPGQLLSGLRARHCDATGALVPDDLQPRLRSRVDAVIRISLRDMLRRQTRSIVHRLHFEGVALDDRRRADVRNTFVDCGLRVVTDQGPATWGEQAALVVAERPIQGETLRVMAYLNGRRHSALRTTELAGGRRYQTKVQSGELDLYLHGRFGGPSDTLAEVLDRIHTQLREVFGATTDHR